MNKLNSNTSELQVDKPFILCVDDEKIVLNSLKEQLRHYLGNSCTIEVAESGSEALELLDEIYSQDNKRPSLIISDQIMPVMKGHELLEQVKANFPEALTILLTGQAQMSDLISVVNRAGLYRYISKPWDKDDLFLTVKEALIAHKAQNDLNIVNDQLRILNKNLEKKVEERTAEIQAQSVELKRRNCEIEQSLTYASRIQKAVLPKADDLARVLKEHFVHYSPQDIVSGDFYFMREINDFVILGIADCTGHGVPGALLSMMSSKILSEIFEKEITTPSEILSELHKSLVNALSQDKNDLEDGLDIALVRIDKKHKRLCFSGAKNNLLVKQSNHLKEIKGDRVSIGGDFYVKREFTNHSLIYDDETTFYLYSDGVPDQFGGPKDKKLGSLQVKNTIASTPSNNAQIVSEKLKNKLNQWMEGYEQTDDITFIGFKPN